VPEDFSKETVRGYLRALDRAEKALEANLPKYLELWKVCISPEFENHPWDYSRFTRGERFVYEPLPKERFDEVFAQVKRWGLDQHTKEHSYEKLSFTA